MMSLLLAAACDVPTLLNTGNNWISINMLVILASFMFAGVLYALGNIMPPATAEKLRRISKYEMFEAFVSVLIIFGVISITVLACNTMSYIVGQATYVDVYNFDITYVGSLLFVNGVSTVSQIYVQTIQFTLSSNLFNTIWRNVQRFASGTIGFAIPFIQLSVGNGLEWVVQAFASTLAYTYSTLLVISFAPLFLVFLLLPVIQGIMLTVLLPVALAMRSLSFAGLKLRESANLFIAIAIGFYFVLPLMIAFNAYIAGCLNIPLINTMPIHCTDSAGNTYATYLPDVINIYLKKTSFVIPSSVSYLFTGGSSSSCGASSPCLQSGTLPFQTSGIALTNSFFGPMLGIPEFVNAVTYIVNGGSVAATYGEEVASYLFVGIFLLGLDFAVTAGFINGVGKGLNSISHLFGLESIFSD